MKRHRWWLAMLGALSTPWIGPHLDGYLPVGWLLLKAVPERPDAGFWLLAGVLLLAAYGLWLALLSAAGAWLSRRRRP